MLATTLGRARRFVRGRPSAAAVESAASRSCAGRLGLVAEPIAGPAPIGTTPAAVLRAYVGGPAPTAKATRVGRQGPSRPTGAGSYGTPRVGMAATVPRRGGLSMAVARANVSSEGGLASSSTTSLRLTLAVDGLGLGYGPPRGRFSPTTTRTTKAVVSGTYVRTLEGFQASRPTFQVGPRMG